MASQAARTALESRLTTIVADAVTAGDVPAGTPVVLSENTTPRPGEHGSFYVTFDYIDVVEDPVCFGAPGQRRYREQGTFAASVIQRRNTGVADLVKTAEAIRMGFRGKRFDDVAIIAAHPMETGDEYGDGKYTRAIVAIDFVHDSIA